MSEGLSQQLVRLKIRQLREAGGTILDLSNTPLKELPAEIFQLTALESLSLSQSQLSKLPAEIGQLTALESLSLSHTPLRELPAEIVQLTALQSLNLSHTQLSELPAEIFQLTALESLKLSQTPLSELPAEIVQLTALEILNLSHTQLSELPAEIFQLIALQSLNLSNTQLSELPAEIVQLTALEILNLSHNPLSELPAEIVQLTVLQSLNLSNTSLKELPVEIFQLTALESLNFSHSPLSELPAEIVQLTALEILNLSHTQLSELPAEIVQLTALEILNLSHTPLSELPVEIGQLTALKSLSLSQSQLRELPAEIGQLTALQSLNLSQSQLRELPVEIGQLTALQSLNLSQSQLRELPAEIGQLTALQSLNLSQSQLRELPVEIGQLTALQSLNLSQSQLRELPAEIGQLTALQSLNLSHTPLRELPAEIGQLTALQSLNFANTRLQPELAAAYDQGLEAILEYLRAQQELQIVVYEGKLVLVGEGGVGKTSLLGALRGEEFIEGRDTTHGVEIRPVELGAPGTEERMTLNAWDFGGQAIYRSTHQLFFTAPAVYLCTWKPREGPEEGRVEEWIKLIKHRAFDEDRHENRPRALVVATHGGPKERQAHIDEEALREQFGELLIGFYHVDSKSGEQIETLKEKIAEIATSLPTMGRRVPASWERVLRAVRQRGSADPWITYDQYLELCAGQEVSVRRAKIYASLLNELGHLIHYPTDPLLKETMILRADWLSKAISFVLEDREIKAQRGLVRHSRLREIWNDPARSMERYPESLHPVFLRLMESFDLTYQVVQPLETERSSLVAELCPGARPRTYRTAWPLELRVGDIERTQICRVIDAQNGLPAKAEGLLYRLIVRLHRYSLGRESYQDSCHWQKGLVLDDAYNGRALIEEIGTDYRITVRAALPDGFLHELSKEVTFLVEHFWKGLDCRIAVPCRPPCKGVIEKEAVAASVSATVAVVWCSSCKKMQPIEGLLPTRPAAPDLEEALETLRVEVLENRRVTREGTRDLSTKLQAARSHLDAQFAALLESLTSEARNGPRLFSLVPEEPAFWDRPKWLSAKFRLTLWCEHSRLPLPLLNGADSTDGVYTLNLPSDWFVNALPFLKTVVGTLNIVLPVAFSAAKLDLDEAFYDRFAKELDLARKSFKAGLQTTEKGADWVMEGESPKDFERGRGVESHGASLRKLHQLLRQEDVGFGGLERVRNKRHEFLWVHPQFVAEDEYRA